MQMRRVGLVGEATPASKGTTAPTRRVFPARPVRQLFSFLFVLLLLVATDPGPHAQQAESSPTFRSGSDLIVLPVTVTDRDGRLMPNLTSERFLVYDNDRPRTLKFFSSEDTPVTVALVVDNSSSMRRRHGEVVAAAATFARLSNPDDDLMAIVFNERVEDVGGRSLTAADEDAFAAALESAVPDGRTALYDAVMNGLDRLDSVSTARKVLILISDGGDNASTASLDAVLERARGANVTIYTIGLFEPGDLDADPGVLKKLSSLSGGERFLPASAGPLLQACGQIAHEIRQSYTLGVEPRDSDGAYHRLRVAISGPDGKKMIVRARPGYVAPAPPRAPARH
jgi:Ca-activated chloride channel homolog